MTARAQSLGYRGAKALGTALGVIVGILVVLAPRLGNWIATRLWGPGWSA